MIIRHYPVGKRVRTYQRDQRNELSEDREPLCVHSVGNEAGEHSWWYLSFLGALATRLAKVEKSRVTIEKDGPQAINEFKSDVSLYRAIAKFFYDRSFPPRFSNRTNLELYKINLYLSN